MSAVTSSSLVNFLQQSSIPHNPPAMMAASSNQCTMNVDGECVRGGTKVAGNSLYSLASMGGSGGMCQAASLFYRWNVPYSVNGNQVTTAAYVPTRPLF